METIYNKTNTQDVHKCCLSTCVVNASNVWICQPVFHTLFLLA